MSQEVDAIDNLIRKLLGDLLTRQQEACGLKVLLEASPDHLRLERKRELESALQGVAALIRELDDLRAHLSLLPISAFSLSTFAIGGYENKIRNAVVEFFSPLLKGWEILIVGAQDTPNWEMRIISPNGRELGWTCGEVKGSDTRFVIQEIQRQVAKIL